jgi:molybdenum cofactor cytidylyltransferase
MEIMPTIREGERSGDTTLTKTTPLYAVVLAAGAGTRFGGGKLHAPFRGGRLVDAAIAAALAAPVAGVVVVVQPDNKTSPHRDPRVRRVECADWAEGMAASLRCGIAALPADAEGVFVFLGDMPRIPPAILPALAEALGAGAPAALPVCEGRDGHPVLFAAHLFPALLSLSGDQGARGVIASLGAEVARIASVDTGVLLDVDTPADLIRLEEERLQGDAPPPIASA